MPTYDYNCDGCGHEFEEWQSFKDDPLTKCPLCKKNKLRRLFGGGAAIIFKGSGFYETDYRRKDEEKKNGKPADDKPAETKADTPKAEPAAAATDSKPETGSKKEPGKAKSETDGTAETKTEAKPEPAPAADAPAPANGKSGGKGAAKKTS